MDDSFPPAVTPMLAAPDRPLVGPAWAWEMKWDGFRGVCRIAGDRLAIDSLDGPGHWLRTTRS